MVGALLARRRGGRDADLARRIGETIEIKSALDGR